MPTDDTRSLETSYTSHRMSPNPFDTAHHGGSDGSAASRRTTHSMAGASTRQFDVTEGIDVGLFEAVVLAKMSARKYEEELKYCFSLLEDSYYEGFITKESLAKAAQAVEEPLTETEIKEMFNALVTGVPTAAIDFSTFVKIQNASKAVQEES
ncbi:caltractin [Angomonas deanei]|nr:caltractin [Angomonas deanei]|eukprot:EPY37913.1 caltractin [Angomonas deanei]